MSVFEVGLSEAEERLDHYLSALFPEKSRSGLQKLIREGAVLVNDAPAKKTGQALHEGDLVDITFPDPAESIVLPEDIPLSILYEDDALLVVDKPKGMVVHPACGHFSGTLVNAVMYHCKDSLSGINGELRPGIVHRIDKNTTGSLVVCKTDEAHRSLAEQLKEHTIKRRYVGLVTGVVKEDSGVIDLPIGRDRKNRKRMAVCPDGKEAVTEFTVLKRFPRTTYMEFHLRTGRTHQIRVHMAAQGHPLFGDEVYGREEKGLVGQTLHAETLGFLHPVTGAYMEFHAPLPAYFSRLLSNG
ncbi:MAG: RluA family pseudouridine synthase [Lachnospiraceae bacterium]|nr:RluA family pseudouridine synthase [Lachnospiraceae bacterium]